MGLVLDLIHAKQLSLHKMLGPSTADLVEWAKSSELETEETDVST
jgi:hypothetical protein